MSTTAPPRPHAVPATPADEPSGAGSALAQWRSSWAVALRMARRDVRRHGGRSALVLVMVLVPTLLLSAATTLSYTSEVSGTEKIGRTMGSGQAYLSFIGGVVEQGADPDTTLATVGVPMTPPPGFDPSADAYANAPAVERLLDQPVSPVLVQRGSVRLGERRVLVSTLALDGRVGLGEKLRLTSGRWPATPRSTTGPVEALVTRAGLASGMPSTGSVDVSAPGGVKRPYEVVGTADVLPGGPAFVTAAPPFAGAPSEEGGWIVRGTSPVRWQDVRAVNDLGFRVHSRWVLEHPPTVDQLPEDVRGSVDGDTARTTLLVALAAVMLLVSTALLVGPAFAVSAARQRRTLALAASNGATTAVLRRTVLAQALVLGAGSATVAVLAGVGAARVVVAWIERDGTSTLGPFDARLGTLAAIWACATASTVVAALVPARRLGRLDVVGVMRGQNVSPPPSVRVFVLGGVLGAIGAGLTLAGSGAVTPPRPVRLLLDTAVGANQEWLVVVGALVLVVGSLLLVPLLLAGVGRVGRHLPTSLRMAARDLARHRGRSAPSVAAVLAAVAGLTFALTGLSSDTAQREREYLPQGIPGEVSVFLGPGDQAQVATIRSAAPGLVVTPTPGYATDPARYASGPQTGPYRAPFLSLVPDGCTPARTLNDPSWQPATEAEQQAGPPCTKAGTEANGSGLVLVLPADELVRRTGVTGADADAVRAGAAVVLGGSEATVRIARGSYLANTEDPGTEPGRPGLHVDQDVVVPAVHLPLTKEDSGRMLGAGLAFAADTTTSRGWPTIGGSVTVRDPSRAPVPDRVVEQLQGVLGADVAVVREDGFQRDDRVLVAVLLGVFALVILVVTLTSTALTLAEQQTDQATLAALGATRGTRRVMAGAQALLLAAVGCVLGVAVGLVPGIAIAHPLTSNSWDPLTQQPLSGGTVLVVPWADLGVVGLLVPVVAGLLAAAGIRRAPTVTRRGG